ncbi:MAG: BlaI/MecI/CopY family transcriptional regulator [Chthoniobacterales bacterium]
MHSVAVNPTGTRRSILDLAPLELDCMNALWPCGEATVRQIQQALLPTRPRAYTTIMTILDRLAQKGIVERHKSGRAWIYRPNISAEEARSHAVSQVVDGFFGGSPVALASHLSINGILLGGDLRESEENISVSREIESGKPSMQELDPTLL